MIEIGNVASGGSLQGPRIDLHPAAQRRAPIAPLTDRPVAPAAQALQDTTSSATASMRAVAERARAAAAGLPDGDALKRFARGIADDLGGGAISGMGRLGSLRNAHEFALVANEALQGSRQLQPFE